MIEVLMKRKNNKKKITANGGNTCIRRWTFVVHEHQRVQFLFIFVLKNKTSASSDGVH
jgi:hypothetical protein